MRSHELIHRLKALPFCFLMPAAVTAHPNGSLHNLAHRMGDLELALALAAIFLAVPWLVARLGPSRQRQEKPKRDG